MQTYYLPAIQQLGKRNQHPSGESASADESEQPKPKSARVAQAQRLRQAKEEEVAAAKAALATLESELQLAATAEADAAAAAAADADAAAADADTAAADAAAADATSSRGRSAAATQPQHVPMKGVLTRERCAKLQAFFTEARFSGPVPKKSFDELKEFAREMGVNPASVIEFDENKWDRPSPNYKNSPGKHRNQLAANVLNAIVKQLQQCCADCKLPFAGLTAMQMQAVEFAHQKKKSPKCPRQTGNCARGSDFEFTFAEYRKCESKCKFCHILEGETRAQRQERLARAA